MIPNTPIVAQWRRHLRRTNPTDVGLGPELRVVYADDRFEWKTVGRRIVRVHWYEGDAAFGAQGAQARRGRGPRDVGAARRDRDGADRLLRLRQRGRLLRRHRSGRPRERRGLGVRQHPDAARADPAGPDRRSAGRGRGSRTSSSTSSSTPRRRTRTTARRAGSTRAWRSTRARATARPTAPRSRGPPRNRHAHPARRADRPVPERPGLLPRLLRERVRRRLHGPDLRPRRPRRRSSARTPRGGPTTRPSPPRSAST